MIVRPYRGRLLRGIINETEAYIGPHDKAAHSYLHPERAPQRWHHKFEEGMLRHAGSQPQEIFARWAARNAKITLRNIAEYLEGGHIYIYMVYGMHWELNFSTAGESAPECVLIRSVIPMDAQGSLDLDKLPLANGPGKLCTYLKLDDSFYAEDATCSERVWLEDAGISVPPRAIKKGPRIGIAYAGKEWAAKPWRFLVEPERLR